MSERTSVRDALATVVGQAERVARVELHLVVEKAKQDLQERLSEMAAKSVRKALGGLLLFVGYALAVGAAISALSDHLRGWQAFLIVAAVHVVVGVLLVVPPAAARGTSVLITRET